MPLDVTFERGGKVLRATIKIGTHWRVIGRTYGLECKRYDEYRGDYKLETRVRLIAQGQSHGVRTALPTTGLRLLTPPAEFPDDLLHEFEPGQHLQARIEAGRFDLAAPFEPQSPWGLTEIARRLRLFWRRQELTSMAPLGLDLAVWVIFHPPKGKPAPVEFEWGRPGELSGQFESNRRKH